MLFALSWNHFGHPSGSKCGPRNWYQKTDEFGPHFGTLLEVHLGALSSKIRRRCSLGYPKPPKSHCEIPKSSIWDLFEVDFEPFGGQSKGSVSGAFPVSCQSKGSVSGAFPVSSPELGDPGSSHFEVHLGAQRVRN